MNAAAANISNTECPSCGRVIGESDVNFCGGCGTPLTHRRPRLRSVPGVAPADRQDARTELGLSRDRITGGAASGGDVQVARTRRGPRTGPRSGSGLQRVTPRPRPAEAVAEPSEPDLDLSLARRIDDEHVDDALIEASGLNRGRRTAIIVTLVGVAAVAAAMVIAAVG